jgi:hypothetical protein
MVKNECFVFFGAKIAFINSSEAMKAMAGKGVKEM